MAHANEEIARCATGAPSKRDMEGLPSFHADDTVVLFPIEVKWPGDHRGK